eukprot:ANDGO_07778.mRNA.1 Ultraviolet-B receptor UVR8
MNILLLCFAVVLSSELYAVVTAQLLGTAVIPVRSVLLMAAGGAHSMVLVSMEHTITRSTEDGSVFQFPNSPAFKGTKLLNATENTMRLLFAWGSNDVGQLGLYNGYYDDSNYPDLVASWKQSRIKTWSKAFEHDSVVSVHASLGSFSCALMEDGSVYAWGAWLGNGKDLPYNDVPQVVPGTAALGISRLMVGAHHTLALTKSGELYGWGSNKNGQLGVADTTGAVAVIPPLFKTPVKCALAQDLKNEKYGLPANSLIVHAETGYSHTIVQIEDGRLFAFGRGDKGQLGTGSTESSVFPLPIDWKGQLSTNEVTRKLACGLFHTLAVTDAGRLFSWGFSSEGQLGRGIYNVDPFPGLVEFFLPQTADELAAGTRTRASVTIQKICVGYAHSVVLMTNGRIWGFGSSNLGQLGVGAKGAFAEPIELLNSTYYGAGYGWKVVDIACGSFHTMLHVSGKMNPNKADIGVFIVAFGSSYGGQVGYDPNSYAAGSLLSSPRQDVLTPIIVFPTAIEFSVASRTGSITTAFLSGVSSMFPLNDGMALQL